MTKTPRSWETLLNCDLAAKAKEHMDADPARTYHNWEHVERLVWHAQYTFEYPFDLALGKAVITHDVIYDALSQKEWRSAEWLFEHDGETPTNIAAARHIMKTAGHLITNDNRMVLLDLADFMFPRMTHDNFYKVMMESMNLYKADPAQIAQGGIDALTQIRDNYADNRLVGLNPPERIAFVAIRTGLERAMMAYEESMKGAKRGG